MDGWRRTFRDPALFTTVIVLWALLALFILFPLAKLLARTFLDGGQVTLANLAAILRDVNHRQAFWNSLLLAALVGLCGTWLGFVYAFAAVRANLSRAWITVLDAASLLPLISPPFTTAIAMIYSFGPRGLITYHLLGIKGFTVYGLHSTLFSETLTYFPIAYLTLKPILAGIDPNVEDMAFSLGSSRWRVFRTVTLPLTVPGLANAFLLLFAASLADFATPLILAGNSFPVLPTQAYLQITGLFDLKGGAVLSFVLLVPALVVYLLQRYWVSRKHYVTITGKVGAQTTIKSLAPWARAPLLGACLLLAGVILYFYVLLFYASAVVALGANHAWTWRHYQVIFTEGLKAIRDTLVIAGAGMPLGGLYGILLGYLVARKIFPGRQAMEIVSMINYALPGTIVGIAYLIAFNDPPIVLTGTALIIVACYVFRYSPTGIRATVALLQQIDPSIEEASQGLGAGSGTTFRRITLPLILPAFFAGLGVVFIRSMTAISATIFLVSINWTLITVRILENMTELSLGPAAAFSVLVVVIVFAVIVAISGLLRRFRTPGAVDMTSILGG
ncbi:MAG: iron ABC transporter permease [candidate division NC10 bacterium RIFCSPLOWO2_12_FULL_66_18]|nr:MAG: iron ABC transporter permease [candidate division NC10 bacterium RIFCSPLOWO2_02_FULL_66_22]OGC01610.1 MAG: iron ABC transporter permease [candidate division NC10 bacterium RIFCSPLOWO2_12_FULL_66_18]